MIEDSRETMFKFLSSVDEDVEVQAITIDPFFSNEIEVAVQEFDPELIVLDLRLKRDENSGFRVLRQLKESASLRDIPVVVCSMHIGKDANDKNKLQAEKLGAVVALPKRPFPAFRDFLKYARGGNL